MARVFITGSADGLGTLAACQLIDEGHSVVLHGRTGARAQDALRQAPGAEAALTADLSDMQQVRDLARQVNELGHFDAVIHNAGLYSGASPQQILAVNSLAPYVLTALIDTPERLIYLSSGLHKNGSPHLETMEQGISYADSKLHVILLAKAITRIWPSVYANAVNPGWVPTKMGGAGAPDDLTEGYATQVWLATSDDADAKVGGGYFYHRQQTAPMSIANNVALQDEYLARCAHITDVDIPMH